MGNWEFGNWEMVLGMGTGNWELRTEHRYKNAKTDIEIFIYGGLNIIFKFSFFH